VSLLLRVLAGENSTRAPIWLMRQAGRHLPEYRALKERFDFWTLVRTPELAMEVTLQPVRRYRLDGAILFSDIMTPLPAMGVDLDFRPGPVVDHPIRSRADVEALRVPEPEAIAPYVAETIRGLRRELAEVPLIGFAGAPLTLASYLVEGSGSKEFATFRAFLQSEPEAAHLLLERLTAVTLAYLRMQVEAGAQAVQLFDSWVGLHDRRTFATFGVPYLRTLLQGLGDLGVPRIYLPLAGSHLRPEVLTLPCEALSLDWREPLTVWRRAAPGVVLQGNLDPASLLAPGPVVAEAAQRVLRAGLGGPHVFNLGHGLFPQTSPDAVQRLVDEVRAVDRHALPQPERA
jgi:uroporphyrinogen decarboxylase